VLLATDNPFRPHDLHQPRDRVLRDVEAFQPQLSPDLPHAVDLPVRAESALQVGAKLFIPFGAI
jgi:hypothetical protein